MELLTTTEALRDLVEGPRPMSALAAGIDVRDVESELTTADLRGLCFLACSMTEGFAARARDNGASVLESLPHMPVSMFPTDLYRVRDLYAGFEPDRPDSWHSTPDYRAFTWFTDPATRVPRPLPAQARWGARTHDTFIEAATTRFLSERGMRVVGVMGGHDVERTDDLYRSVAQIARAVSRKGRCVVSGGGPGLMEAANLGAFLAGSPDTELDEALTILEDAPEYTSSGWLSTAARVRARVLGRWDAPELPAAFSLGVPTWHYGHEPPNMFASHSAKFFFNSLREDGLVTIADGGLLFAPGNAGTVQEIFQDATQNYYRPSGSPPTPMVLLDRRFWEGAADHDSIGAAPNRRPKPLWPLLQRLASEKGAEHGFEHALTLTDDPEEIVRVLTTDATDKGTPLAYRLAMPPP